MQVQVRRQTPEVSAVEDRSAMLCCNATHIYVNCPTDVRHVVACLSNTLEQACSPKYNGLVYVGVNPPIEAHISFCAR